MMMYLEGINKSMVFMKLLALVFSLFMVLVNLFPQPAIGAKENDESGYFVVTGHIHRKVEIGANKNFVEKAVPFINRINPDFLIFMGDMIFGYTGAHRSTRESIRRQFNYVIQNVFNKIKTKIYCVAGNHDTHWNPDPPSIEIFAELFNPLPFSFEHKASLFLVLSLYEPFLHMASARPIFPFKMVWDEYGTPASRAFLDNLCDELKGRYDHIFIFVHISPVSDYPIGYYWSQFLIPLLSSLKQDIHIFSTDQFNKLPFHYNVRQVVKYNNIRFYCFARFPRGSYIVHFDNHNVRVDLSKESNFIPTLIQEVDFQPTTRLTMLRSYISFWCNYLKRKIEYYYNKLIQKTKQLFGKLIPRTLS